MIKYIVAIFLAFPYGKAIDHKEVNKP